MKVVLFFCVIVTETEMLRVLPLTKLYSGKQCYICTCAEGKCFGEWLCKYIFMYSLINVGVLYIKKALNIQFNVHIHCKEFFAALAMQYWCWKCLDSSLCLKMYLQVSFWMFLLNITKIYLVTLHCHLQLFIMIEIGDFERECGKMWGALPILIIHNTWCRCTIHDKDIKFIASESY